MSLKKNYLSQGCHLALTKVKSAYCVLFRSCLAYFLAFLKVDENSTFYGLFYEKLETYYEILKFVLVTLTNFQRKFGLYMAFLNFWGFGLFKTLYTLIWPFSYFWTWQHWLEHEERENANVEEVILNGS